MNAAATKADLLILKLELQNDIKAVQLDMHRELHHEIEIVTSKLHHEINSVKSELHQNLSSNFKWTLTLLAGFFTAILGVMAKGFQWV